MILPGLCLVLLPTIVFAQQKHALFVAVGEYERPGKLATLKYPEDDARAIKSMLEREDGTGYEVTLLAGKDATKDRVLKALHEIAKKGKGGGYLILGFFGHGVQYGADAYFCPFDTDVRPVVGANGKALFNGNKPLLQPDPETMVPMREMLLAMTQSDAMHKLLLADCCREDPTRARGLAGRAFGSELKLEDLPRNSAAMFACSREEQAYELDEVGHGAFTQAFLDAFKRAENPTANELSVSVSRGVQNLVRPMGVKQNVNTLLSGSVVELGIENPNARTKSFAPEMRAPNAPKLNEPTAAVPTTTGKESNLKKSTPEMFPPKIIVEPSAKKIGSTLIVESVGPYPGSKGTADVSITLESDDGRKVPIANKEIVVSSRINGGPTSPVSRLRTDRNGLAKMKTAVLKDQPRGYTLVFEFAGDEIYESTSKERKQVK